MLLLIKTIIPILMFGLLCIYLVKPDKFVGFFIMLLPIYPLFQKTFADKTRLDIDISYFMIDIVFIYAMALFIFLRKNERVNNILCHEVRVVNMIMLVWVMINFCSIMFSIDFQRSFLLFLIGVIGPTLFYYLISNKMTIDYRNLSFYILSYVVSGIVIILMGVLMLNQRVETVGTSFFDLRQGGNIYGSNAIIEAFTFILPVIFINLSFWDTDHLLKKSILLFRFLSIPWILFALSRQGYATFFILFFLILVVDKKIKKTYMIVLLIALLLFVYFLLPDLVELIKGRFLSDDIYTLNDRTNTWEIAWNYISDNIIFGSGLGTFYQINPRSYTNAHNLFISLLTERGIFVLLSFLSILFYFYNNSIKFIRKTHDMRLKRISLLLSFGVTAYLFHTITGGDLVSSSGYLSALNAYYFSFSLGLQIYLMKLDGLVVDSSVKRKESVLPVIPEKAGTLFF